MSLSPSAPTFCITVFYFVVESVKFGGCLLISGTCVRKSNGGELRGESERKLKICHHYVYVCSIFITILSIFANLHTHSCCLCESTNQVHTNTYAYAHALDCAICRYYMFVVLLVVVVVQSQILSANRHSFFLHYMLMTMIYMRRYNTFGVSSIYSI